MPVNLSNRKYEEIKKLVVSLYEMCSYSSIPISAFNIALKLGIKVVRYSDVSSDKRQLLFKISIDGFCFISDTGEWRIYYNSDRNTGRINNTIMHEIGHIVLNHSEDSELAEKEVNFFAKYALAPPVLVYALGINGPNQLARLFYVSFEAAKYAYKYFQKWLCARMRTIKYNRRELRLTTYEVKTLSIFSSAITAILESTKKHA